MSNRKLYVALASALGALENCRNANVETPWESRWEQRINYMVKNHMPSGSGFDCGTEFDQEASNPNKLVFRADSHNMDDYGGYDGWSRYTITVTPSLVFGFTLRVTMAGKNRRYADKDYVADIFHQALDRKLPDSELYGEDDRRFLRDDLIFER